MNDSHPVSTESPEQVGSGTVVSFHYELYDADSEKLESSRDNNAPVLFLFGSAEVLPALQAAMQGKRVGDDFSVSLPHGQAYGRYYPERQRRVSRSKFDDGKRGRLKVGDRVLVEGPNGRQAASVVKLGKFNIDLDLNHPLAGKDLTFVVTIESIRQSSESERAHGHAHGPGGHQHS